MIRSLQNGHPSGTWVPYDWRVSRQSIADRFAEVARRYPDRLAACDTVSRLTYGELECSANRVANAILSALGQGQEAIVILADVNTTAIVAALGVLKANKFYVGLDPSFPSVRAEQIVQDTGAKLILAETLHLPLARKLARPECRIIDLNDLTSGDDSKPGIPVHLDAIAVINYTSGSTGQPKGVVHTHRSALAQAVRYVNAYRLSDADRMTNFGSLAWASGFWDTFGPLCLGACVASYDVKRCGMHGMVDWIRETGVTVMSGMTVTCGLAGEFSEQRFPEVRLIQLGGDTVYRRHVEACQRVFANAVIAVGLGLTEAGRVAELFLLPGSRLGFDIAPIGYPVPGIRFLLLSENGTEVHPGETGEIAVQSADLAQGYWRRPALTEEKFRRDPRGGLERIYLTGDMGRQLDGGLFQHEGRKDFRSKFGGIRCQPTKLKSKLLEIGGIREACVVAKGLPDGNQELVAYLVADEDNSSMVDLLRSSLGDHLPDHMVPNSFVFLDKLPKTLTGKVDRRALPDRNSTRPKLEEEYVAPRTPIEAILGSIWSEVLGIDRVGINDGFLTLGGDSLRATQIMNRVELRFGVSFSFRQLLRCHTVAEMAVVILDQRIEHTPPEQSEA